MKKALVVSMLILVIFLTGCGKKANTTTVTKTPDSKEVITVTLPESHVVPGQENKEKERPL